jgi:hypothetical protein
MIMIVSAELRWFWQGELPRTFEDWFYHAGAVPGGGVRPRRDRYFHQKGNRELGIKVRDEGGTKAREVEIKGLVGLLPETLSELWCKWTSSAIPDDPGILVEKTRWLRRLSLDQMPVELPLGKDEKPLNQKPMPQRGCNIELTKVTIENTPEIWWTIGFEAFGDVTSAPEALRRALDLLRPPAFDGAKMSYPAWLDQQ